MAASKEETDGEVSKGQDEKPLNEVLGDVARFSYLGSVSISLGLMYPGEWHRKWNGEVIADLKKHLKMSDDSLPVMENMMQEKATKENQALYIKKLIEDPNLIRNEIILQDLLSLALKSGAYDARMRVLIYRLGELCQVDPERTYQQELMLVEKFIHAQTEMTEEELREKKKSESMRKYRRYFAVGAATLAGGALIGLTGGLAAPLVASASIALLGPGIAFIGTHAGIVAMASVFGVAGAGLTGYKMKKRVGEVEEFEFESLTEGRDLHVTLCISGWLTKDRSDNFYMPWLTVDNSKEIYCLKWESKYLMELGESLEYLLNKVMTIAAKEALKYTVLAGLMAALALPATAYASLTAIDNPWGIATNRAAEVGQQLAEVLLMRQQGKRPITLIGFSMGARAIYFCLKELASRTGCEGIIQDVYLLGAPVPFDRDIWEQFPRVVAGKIYNGYCRGDWLLQFVYRTASAQVNNIVGLDAVPWKHDIMVNKDLTEIVSGHLDYSNKMDVILKEMGIRQKERRTSSCLSKLTKGKLLTKDRPPDSGEEAQSDDQSEETLCIDAKDLNLSPTRKKMEEATGFSSDVTKSPSLNLFQSRSTQDKKRSQSMMEISEAVVGGGTREEHGSFQEETDVKNDQGNVEIGRPERNRELPPSKDSSSANKAQSLKVERLPEEEELRAGLKTGMKGGNVGNYGIGTSTSQNFDAALTAEVDSIEI
ncbi:transmembrane and coiled-coil domain-containing protein 4-like isoform X2 [Apostichopus japonicus]|uniref:transmembrane and coiled-coil domain-containing protein 4-like isoform X2 n=1 Tax=Stichopus japonicus TaxID=307972 RepID=UPI003AB58F53